MHKAQVQQAQKPGKFVVAVHGIGDQVAYETIQTVAHQFCHYFNTPSAIPLGQIHSALNDADAAAGGPHKHGIFIPPDLAASDTPATLGFGEVYWADIPRKVVASGFVLEETKKWSRTIVDRVRSRGALEDKDYDTIKRVLSEMIETVNVLERLSFLAEKAGLFKFRLNQVLKDYVDDVQIVTEYEKYRKEILERFDNALSAAHNADPAAELYIVAHSEGTVVALLGLLNAITSSEREKYSWLGQVRGLMTIGSPIDKHLVLWDDLIGQYAGNGGKHAVLDTKIKWKNYYDHGDPVGSKLDLARAWLAEKGITHFEFKQADDYGFSRYVFPGKAHTDYWNDHDVFGHFIGSVMELQPPKEKQGKKEPVHPKSDWIAVIATNTLPYVLMFGLLLAGTHVLYSFLTTNLAWGESSAARTSNTFAVAFLLAGLTVLARVPRLTKEFSLKLLSIVTGFLAIALFYRYATQDAANNLEALSNFSLYLMHIDYDAQLLGLRAPIIGMSGAMLLIAGVTYLASELKPLWGLKPLIIIGGTAALGIETLIIITNPDNLKVFADLQVLWQLALSCAIFLYIWWFAALLFDLVFVWHSYIRSEKLITRQE